jgi:hypothetical protein
MPSPFPGMDPYLEDPEYWPGVHTFLIAVYAELLNKLIVPKYVARIEQRVYMATEVDEEEKSFQRVSDVKIDRRVRKSSPSRSSQRNGSLAIAEPVIVRESDPVRERRVEIREIATKKVVTVIELLSPANKVNGTAGRESFTKKRREVLESDASWVEIDLLRDGRPHPKKHLFGGCDYFVYSSPVTLRPDGKVWPLRIEDPLPVIGIPLRDPDPEAPLDLQAALNLAYERAAYDATIDYTKRPVPPLPPTLAKWAKKLFKPRKAR